MRNMNVHLRVCPYEINSNRHCIAHFSCTIDTMHKASRTVHHQVTPMTIERTFQGAWRISAIIDGYLVTRQFMGYTKREAINAFKGKTK